MELLISHDGDVRCIYAETIPLCEFGDVTIERGSHVEPTACGTWTADLSPVDGPVLGPFTSRSEALQSEHHWLTQHWLNETHTT